jgi:hypothetical protein
MPVCLPLAVVIPVRLLLAIAIPSVFFWSL